MNAVNLLGFSAAEYQAMFDLSAEDLDATLLDCYPGPGSFNAELTLQDKTVTSCDPLYLLEQKDIEIKLRERCRTLEQFLLAEQSRFNWSQFESPTAFINQHEEAIESFCEDYIRGKKQSRYLVAKFPHLNLPVGSFDIALCSHYLFSQTEHQTEKFILDSIIDMCRVAHEARLFPLLDPNGQRSEFLAPVMLQLQQKGYGVELRQVNYEFQHGGNAMLRVWLDQCDVE